MREFVNGDLANYRVPELPRVVLLYPESFTTDRWSRCQRKQPLHKALAWARAYLMTLRSGVRYERYRCPYSSVNLVHFHVGRVIGGDA